MMPITSSEFDSTKGMSKVMYSSTRSESLFILEIMAPILRLS